MVDDAAPVTHPSPLPSPHAQPPRRKLVIGVIALVTLAAIVAAFGWSQPQAGRVAIGLLFAIVFTLASLLAIVWRQTGAENAKLVDHLDHLAHEDALTGITNRRGLDLRLPQEMARALRSGQPLTVAMLDLDHFKRFNDRRGHGAGDALLRGTAQAWRKQLRPSDLLARYGGEEFTLVLPACDSDQAELLIDRLRPLMPDRQTFSAGIATWNGADSAAELLRTADIALLAAKKAGRNRTMVAGREPQMGLPLRVA